MSVLDKKISYYRSINATNKGIEVNLLKILQSKEHEAKIAALRLEPNPNKQKALKELLPCYTVAGLFAYRNETGLISHSGLAAIDLDNAEDYDIFQLLNELKKLPYIAYAGLSCRGNRLFCIIPFLYPDKYLKHYQRLIKSFEDIGLPMGDTCHKQISQPRFVSFNTDNTCFYNHTAKPYHLLQAERTHHYRQPSKKNSSKFRNDNIIKVEQCIREIENRKIDIAPDYETYMKIGYAFANEFGEQGRDLFHKVCTPSDKYIFDETERDYSKFLKSKRQDRKNTIATFFHWCDEYGISVKRYRSDPHEDFKDPIEY